MIIAIDPGPENSGVVEYNPTTRAIKAEMRVNNWVNFFERKDVKLVAIEMVACYGMAVGASVFETCVWIGRFIERAKRADLPVMLIYRKDIKLEICGSLKAKDTNIRQALIDIFGEPGTKKNPGPTYGITSHLWAALALALVASRRASPPQI